MSQTRHTDQCPGCGAWTPAVEQERPCSICGWEVPAEPPEPGRLLGDCELLEEIGRGGMGVVWRGRQRALNREVAVKTLAGNGLDNAESRARFRTEAQATARLRHPNIVPVFDVGESDGMPFLVMELVAGRNLREVIGGNPVPPRLAAEWVRSAAHAVQHAHEQGVFHRDLKPSNLLVETTPNGSTLRVTDFGLAKLADFDPGITRTGTTIGSPSFMPPEQARGEEFTPRSDVYSLGAVLFNTLTGRPPFLGDSPAVVLAQVETAEPIPPRRLNPAVPVDLETICLRCLEKNPANRYTSARELADDLARYLDGQPVLARPVGPISRVLRMSRRHPWRATAISLAALLVVGTGLLLAWNVRTERRHSEALLREQAATRNALLQARLGEAQAILRLRQADSRPRAEALLQQILADQPPTPWRERARDALVAAHSLHHAHTKPLPGPTAVSSDWTMAVGDLARGRWAQATFNNGVVLRDLDSSTHLSAFATAPRVVTALIGFSPGGRWLAMRHREELGIWDTTPGATKPLAFVQRAWPGRHSFNLNKVTFTPDDATVFWIDDDSVVATALPTGTSVARFPFGDGADRHSGAIAMDPSGRFLGIALPTTPTVEIRSWPEGERLEEFSRRFTEPLSALALGPRAELIAGGDPSGRITVWRNVSDFGPPLEFHGHSEGIRALRFSGDGRFLASTSQDGTLRVWDCRAGTEFTSLHLDAGVVSFSTNDLTVGVGMDAGRVVLAHLDPSPLLHRFRPYPPTGLPQVVSFAPDGQSLYCLTDIGIQQCAIPGGRTLAFHPRPKPLGVSVDPAAPGRFYSTSASGVLLHAPDPRTPPATIAPALLPGWDSIAASVQSRWMVASDVANARIALWRSEPMAEAIQPRLVAVEHGAGSLALSPDGSRLAMGFRHDPGLHIMDLNANRITRKLSLPGGQNLAWSPDGRWLAASGTTNVLWDTTTWTAHPLPDVAPCPPPSGGTAFGASPAGQPTSQLALASGGTRIVLIEPATQKVIATLEAPEGRVLYQLAFSPNLLWLAAASAQGEIQLWNLAHLRKLTP
jgi:eukaryotic-like serine/threonine-protein kinase